MVKSMSFLRLLSIVVIVNTVQGDLLWYEAFDYPAGTSVADNGPWATSTNGVGSPTTLIHDDDAGLTYAGLSTQGGAATMTGNSNDAINVADSALGGTAGNPRDVAWATPDTGVYYITMLMSGGQNDLWHQPFRSIIRYRNSAIGIENTDSSNMTVATAPRETALIALRIDTDRIDRTAQGLGDPQNLQQMIVNPDLLALGGAEPNWDLDGVMPIPRNGGQFLWPEDNGNASLVQF